MKRLLISIVLILAISISLYSVYAAQQILLNTGFENGIGGDADNWIESTETSGGGASATVTTLVADRFASTAMAGNYVMRLAAAGSNPGSLSYL